MKTTFALTLAAASASAVLAAPQASGSGGLGGLSSLGPLINGLSSACLGTFGSLALNSQDPLNQCLSLTDAIGTFTTASSSNSSLVGPLNTYLTNDICGKAPCTAATLDGAKATLENSCRDDFEKNNGTNVAAIFQILLQEYWTIRDAACLSDSAKNENCVIQAANAAQTASNYQLTLSNVLSLGSNEQQAMSLFEPLLKNKDLTCTDCNKAVLSSVFKDLGLTPDQLSQAVNSTSMMGGQEGQLIAGVQQQCGATFFDGQIPASVKNTSTPLSSTGSSGTKPNAAVGSANSGASAAAALLALVGAGAALLA